MTRLYLKIFFTFWVITALIIVSTNVIVHWFDLTPDRKLHKHQYDREYEPARRLLFQMVGSAINRNTTELAGDMEAMPVWSTQYFYIVNAQEEDLLGRPLPPGVVELLPRLTEDSPFGKVTDEHRKIFGRYLSLNDGERVKVVTLSSTADQARDVDVIQQLFLRNIWPLLLVSILICGFACFFLARFFSRGINTLQKATHRIANGDLSVRVSPQLAGRRDEIARLGLDFDHMTERLERAMFEQKRLIKDVSHELRSPLARLQVALGLAKQRSDGSVDRELDRVKKAADYLGDVISDILALPVHESGSWELDDTLDLRSLLDTLVENYQGEAERKKVRLLVLTDLGEALVATHGNMLVGVFENILRNAVHYTSRDSEIRVELSFVPNKKAYLVAICDTGPGVPEESLEDIFQPFYRTDEARNRESGGYGLGLAIAQRSVALHQGSIEARNLPEGGLCVSVFLPAEEEAQ
ncbi:ATP-binding protein [Marinimicrobium sp. ABcell2]|uniref:ATP-binding protein n=1 Tax=Marinimicrobium sp. ABcell2 TaxID=3069751 RepID=UPI0027B4D399|nr:ATP-binding protein [Marinimicrobium sp. ABcell2]MDQ2075561.1 ATP-binding protein [Marinimicrobium sp. ABcell2]